MSTPDHLAHSVSIPIPIFTGITTEFRKWQLLIRDFAALRNKIVGSITPDIYLQLFRTDFDRLNAGPDSLYYVLDIKFRLESAADICSPSDGNDAFYQWFAGNSCKKNL